MTRSSNECDFSGGLLGTSLLFVRGVAFVVPWCLCQTNATFSCWLIITRLVYLSTSGLGGFDFELLVHHNEHQDTHYPQRKTGKPEQEEVTAGTETRGVWNIKKLVKLKAEHKKNPWKEKKEMSGKRRPHFFVTKKSKWVIGAWN